MGSLGIGCDLRKMRMSETLKPRVLYKAFIAFKRKLCMREMQCAVHTVLSVQMKLKHFVLILFVTMLLSLNAINSYFINLSSFVLA